MKRYLAIIAMLTAMTGTPALATGGLYCGSPIDPSVEASLTIGRVPGFAVVGAIIGAGDKVWTMPGGLVPGAGEIVLAQGSNDGTWIIADFADADVSQILIKLRLAVSMVEDSSVVAGSLWIQESGHWPVVCELE